VCIERVHSTHRHLHTKLWLCLLAFIEFLVDNKYNVATVNYISSCKSKYKQLQLPIVAFQSELIKFSFRSVKV
jgi:hypothetical protein